MRKDLILPVAGALLVALCCAGPLLLAGLGSALVLAALRAHLVVIVVPVALAAIVAVIVVVRARRS
jgi:hypothetical protein